MDCKLALALLPKCCETIMIFHSQCVSNHLSGLIFSLSDFDVTLSDIPILLDDVICSGNETSLVQCSHDGYSNHDCSHSEDIVLACVGERSTDLVDLCAVVHSFCHIHCKHVLTKER